MFKQIIVHRGTFHADDVFCVALMKVLDLCVDGYARKVPTELDLSDPNVLVADVGLQLNPTLNNFDHHVYAGGPCSFELLCRDLVPWAMEDSSFSDFVCSISEQDTQGIKNELSQAIKVFNPNWDEELHEDEQFYRALQFATAVLDRKLEAVRSKRNAVGCVKDCLIEETSLGVIGVSDCFFPWKETEGMEEVQFFVSPSNRGGYNVAARNTQLKPLPKEWLENKPDGCTFVHQGLFLAAFKSFYTALTACGFEIENLEEEEEE